MSVGGDLGYPHVAGRRTVKTRVLGAYVARLMRVAGRHAGVAGAFLRVANLMAPPQALLAPGVVARVLRSGGRTPGGPPNHAPTGSSRAATARVR
jgi:hypothetical protein